jgi:hypothetical protein
MTGSAAWTFAHRPAPVIRATTATKIASLYDAWSMTLPPDATSNDRKAASYARTVATKHGWLPPLAWDDIDHDPEPPADDTSEHVDWVVVERILLGDRAPATTAERRAVVARWPDTGRPYADLARLTGWNVDRYHPTATGLEEEVDDVIAQGKGVLAEPENPDDQPRLIDPDEEPGLDADATDADMDLDDREPDPVPA